MRFFRKPAPDAVPTTIMPSTPPDLAASIMKVWQRGKELQLLEDMGTIIKRAEHDGLAKVRIARVLLETGKALESGKVGG